MMSLVSFSDKFGQNSSNQNYQLGWNYINAIQTIHHAWGKKQRFHKDFFRGWKDQQQKLFKMYSFHPFSMLELFPIYQVCFSYLVGIFVKQFLYFMDYRSLDKINHVNSIFIKSLIFENIILPVGFSICKNIFLWCRKFICQS